MFLSIKRKFQQGKEGKIECKLIGPKRFWKDKNITQPESQIVINNRQTKSILIEHVGVEQKLLGGWGSAMDRHISNI